jgi:hypothetical protein
MLPHLIEFAHAMAFVIASEAKQSHVGHASHPLPEIASSSARRTARTPRNDGAVVSVTQEAQRRRQPPMVRPRSP